MEMRYISTRGGIEAASFEDCLLRGLAADGGLYMPQSWPALPQSDASIPYAERLITTLSQFGAGPISSLAPLAARALAGFRHPDIAPLRQLDADLYLLELFHGPTAAFKDLAMQAIAQVLDEVLARRDEHLLLLTATSGDTGAAAVQAFAGSRRVRLMTLHPKGKISPVQRRQMTTCAAPNIVNLAIAGDFDDCQRVVKALLGQVRARDGWRISSVNSINWGRLAAQIPYFLHASACMENKAARFIVPTGNFGDAFSGWAARACGARIGSLVAAVNRNDSLAQTFASGIMRHQKTIATPSVSMDVQAPSNLERLVFEAAGRDSVPVCAAFEALAADGRAALPQPIVHRLRMEMQAVSINDDAAAEAMLHAYQVYGEMVCPHTAVGLAAARARGVDGPTIVLATAHPAKFPDSIMQVLGVVPALPLALQGMEGLPEIAHDCRADVEEVSAWMQRAMHHE